MSWITKLNVFYFFSLSFYDLYLAEYFPRLAIFGVHHVASVESIVLQTVRSCLQARNHIGRRSLVKSNSISFGVCASDFGCSLSAIPHRYLVAEPDLPRDTPIVEIFHPMKVRLLKPFGDDLYRAGADCPEGKLFQRGRILAKSL